MNGLILIQKLSFIFSWGNIAVLVKFSQLFLIKRTYILQFRFQTRNCAYILSNQLDGWVLIVILRLILFPFHFLILLKLICKLFHKFINNFLNIISKMDASILIILLALLIFGGLIGNLPQNHFFQ